MRTALHTPMLFLVVAAVALSACGVMPPLETQEQFIRKENFPLRKLSLPAFQRAWGPPTHVHHERTQFFSMPDGNLIPRFRVTLGDSPQGWDGDLVGGEAISFVYAKQGWLFVFLEDILVYREQLSAEQVQALRQHWQREAQFKTRFEVPPPPAP